MCAGKTCKTETIAPHTAQAALSTVARPHLVHVRRDRFGYRVGNKLPTLR